MRAQDPKTSTHSRTGNKPAQPRPQKTEQTPPATPTPSCMNGKQFYRNLCPVPNSTSSSPSITISWKVGWLDVDLDQRCELNTNLSLSGSGAISGRSKKAKFLRIVLTLRFAFAISNNLG